jgi:hypothetical protein
MRQPMPTVEFEGKTYSLRSRSTAAANLPKLDKISALIWLNQNATRRGFQKPRPLIACSVGVR